MDLETEDRDFEILLGKKRHDELKGLIQRLRADLLKSNKDEVISNAISEHTKRIVDLVGEIRSIDFKVPQQNVVDRIDNLFKQGETILELLSEQNKYLEQLSKEKQWEHKVIRNQGSIEKIISAQIKK